MNGGISLQYVMRTITPVIVSEAGSDQNLVSSLDHLRGRAILGSLAARYIRSRGSAIDPGCAHEDPDFSRLFLSNRVRFLNPLPAQEDERVKDYIVFAPPSLAVQAEKHSNVLHNLLETEPATPTKPIGRHASISGRVARLLSVPKEIRFHNARSISSASRQHALRQGHTTSGGIFNYEAIAPGELFWGEIWGDAADLAILKQLIEEDPTLNIGRSRSAQYGLVRVERTQDGVVGHESLVRRYGAVATPSLQDDEMLLYFVSPTIITGRLGAGQVTAQSIADAISELLDPESGRQETLEVESAFLRETAVESYVGTWQMKTPRAPAIAAGSVVLLKQGSPWTAEQRSRLRDLEVDGMGARTNEGNGQVLALMDDDQDVEVERSDRYCGVPRKPDRPPGEPPAMLVRIAETIAEERMSALVQRHAIQDASSWSGHVSSSLLGKLEAIALHRTSMADLRACLPQARASDEQAGSKPAKGVLRKTAVDQLKQCYKGRFSLFEELSGTDTDALSDVFTETETLSVLELLRECGARDLVHGDKDRWLLTYWAQLLRALRKKASQEEP